jgi:general stress protein 26
MIRFLTHGSATRSTAFATSAQAAIRRSRVLATTGLVVAGLGHAAIAQTPAAAPVDRRAVLAASRAIMTKVGVCSVITIDETGRAQARAIDAFPPDEQMVVWFATNPKSRKVAQIKRDPRVTLYYYDPAAMEYVTLLGRARLVADPVEKQKHWKDSFRAFWSDRGEGYPLVEVTPERLEVVSPTRKILNDPVTWQPVSITFEPVRRK